MLTHSRVDVWVVKYYTAAAMNTVYVVMGELTSVMLSGRSQEVKEFTL